MTTPTTHGVPLPTGAEADIWEDDGSMPYRVLHGVNRGVEGHSVSLWTHAIQFGDGSIDQGRIEHPGISMEEDGREALNNAHQHAGPRTRGRLAGGSR